MWLWDDMPLNLPKRPPYCNSTSAFDFDHITAVDMSFCTILRNLIQIGPPTAQKNDVVSIFKMADLGHDFSGPIMGSLKSPCTTSCRSPIALNCLVFEEIAFFLHFGDRRTDGQHRCTKPLALAVASGGLKMSTVFLGRLRKVDLIILEGKNVCPSVRPSVRPSVIDFEKST